MHNITHKQKLHANSVYLTWMFLSYNLPDHSVDIYQIIIFSSVVPIGKLSFSNHNASVVRRLWSVVCGLWAVVCGLWSVNFWIKWLITQNSSDEFFLNLAYIKIYIRATCMPDLMLIESFLHWLIIDWLPIPPWF